MREHLNEIFIAMKHNKLRTILTGFSVAWGVYILMILIGVNSGFSNGIMSQYEGLNVNNMQIFGGRTDIPYGGYGSGRMIEFTHNEVEVLKRALPEIKRWELEIRRYGEKVVANKQSTNCSLVGISADYKGDNATPEYIEGGNISQLHIKNRSRVAVIDNGLKESLWGADISVLGEKINIGGADFTIIGVIKEFGMTSIYSGEGSIYIPISTFNVFYPSATREIGTIYMGIEGLTPLQHSGLEKKIYSALSKQLNFDINDRWAIYIRNLSEEEVQRKGSLDIIKYILWVIGLGVLSIGVVGVSNIVIVTVSERTYEFGVRKSMGASPASITRLVLIESIALTSIFGYIGMFLGIGTVWIMNRLIEGSDMLAQLVQSDYMSIEMLFKDGAVAFTDAVNIVFILIVAGAIAGYIPARKASRLRTVDALRHNK